MSESPAYAPPFVRAAHHAGLPLRASHDDRQGVERDLEDDDGGDTLAADADAGSDADPDVQPAPPARLREGLPPSYRMRAEPHYVEALVERSRAVVEPAAARPASVPLVPALPAMPAVQVATTTVTPGGVATLPEAVVAATLADAFEAIQAALRDVPLRGRPLRDRVAIELARAEATRGRWLADAAVVLRVEPLAAIDEIDLLRVLRDVVASCGPENRLSGGGEAMPVPSGTCLVFGDEGLLTTALGALLAAVRALVEDRGDLRKVSVTLGPRHETATRTIEISQMAVRVPASLYARFFDAGWTEHPAGASGAVLLAAARRIACAHGGDLEIRGLDGGGSQLVLSLPAAD